MNVTASPPSVRTRDIKWLVGGVLGLLLLTVLAIIPLTLTIIHSRESDAFVIDLAGRQRMLLERHLKEVLLASMGAAGRHQRPRAVLEDHVQTLIQGGHLIPDDRGEATAVPAAPTEAIRQKLLEQQRLMRLLFDNADAFLRDMHAGVPGGPARDALIKDNAELLDVANETVTLLTHHSEHNIQTLISWELAVVFLIVVVAALGIRRFLQVEKALRTSQAMTIQALHQRDAVKTSLLSSVSHELRTPLTAIKTMLFGLRHDGEPPSPSVREEFLTGIDRELEYLNGLVGNLLDMSRLDAGTLTPRREWHILDELVEGAIRRINALLTGRDLQVALSPDLPPISVDGVQIQQVLVNLLDNAIKFSQPGTPIRLTAALAGDVLELRVSNTGEGVPAEDLERIFDRFYRIESGRSSAPGTGLGLAICKSIVEAHGGSILAQSIPGQQTTIIFRIPLTASLSTERRILEPPSILKAS
jgi:two-component system, OmpR family, sensor histidine kinase KdpD